MPPVWPTPIPFAIPFSVGGQPSSRICFAMKSSSSRCRDVMPVTLPPPYAPLLLALPHPLDDRLRDLHPGLRQQNPPMLPLFPNDQPTATETPCALPYRLDPRSRKQRDLRIGRRTAMLPYIE